MRVVLAGFSAGTPFPSMVRCRAWFWGVQRSSQRARGKEMGVAQCRVVAPIPMGLLIHSAFQLEPASTPRELSKVLDLVEGWDWDLT